MRSSAAFFIVLTFISSVFADVKFSTPAAGGSVPAGTAYKVTWTDSTTAPVLADLKSYNLLLFTGSNTNPLPVTTLITGGLFTAGNSVSITVPPGIGGPGKNAYFLQITSVANEGGDVINYSDRFTMTGMTGTFTAEQAAALKDVSGTAGPPTSNNVGAADGADASGTADGEFGVTYTAQVGNTRYARMQPVPGTKITATNTAPMYPTSSVSFATTFLPSPSIATTLTQPQTYSASSHANTAAAAPQPTDDMQRFLARWKD